MGRSTGNYNQVMTLSAGRAKDALDHRFRESPSRHCPIAKSALTQSQQPVNRMANKI